MRSWILNVCLINRELLRLARAMPRYDEDGLFAIEMEITFPPFDLTLSIEEFADRHLIPALAEAWRWKRDYSDDPPFVPPNLYGDLFRYGDMVSCVLNGYHVTTSDSVYVVDIRVDPEIAER